MSTIKLVIAAVLIAALSAMALALKYAHQEIGALNQSIKQVEQLNNTLGKALVKKRNEQALLNQLYKERQVEAQRVQSNLEKQLQQIKNTKGDACADAAVSDERINILRSPVWQAGE